MKHVFARGVAPLRTDLWDVAIGEDKIYSDIGQNSMKPALFSASAIVNKYQKSCDTLKSINKHLSSERLRFLNPIMLYGSNLFQVCDEKEMYSEVVRTLNAGRNVDSFLANLPDDICERLNSRTDRVSAEYCVILLNNDVDTLNLENMLELLEIQHKDKSGDIHNAILDDFQINLFCVKNSDWIDEKLFNHVRLYTDVKERAGEFARWCKANYDFLQKLQLTYYYPGKLISFARTKGIDFAACVITLFHIKDRVSMQYWNWDSDLWLNFNLVGYNPTKSLSRYWRALPNTVNPGAINALTPQHSIQLWVSAMNSINAKLTNRAKAADMRDLDWLTRFSDPHLALAFCNRSADYIGERSEWVKAISTAGIDPAIAALELERHDEGQFNTFPVFEEYSVSYANVDMGDVPAAIAASFIPAFTHRGQALNFSELTQWDPMPVDHPKAMDLFCYLYKHRNWSNKPQPVHIGRGRYIDIHPHSGISYYTSNDWREIQFVKWEDNPSVTFREGMEHAGRESSENVDGPDFIHFPAVVQSVIIAHEKFFHIRNPFDLVAEGRTMGHCAGGSNYIRACNRQDRVFFHYQPENTNNWHEGVTFDCDLDLDIKESKAFVLSSTNRLHNASPSAEERTAIHEFIEKLNKAWSEYANAERAKESDQLAKAC